MSSKILFTIVLSFFLPLLASASTQEIANSDIKIQFGNAQPEEAVQLSINRDASGLTIALATNKGNYLLMKFERSIEGFELGFDVQEKIMGTTTYIVPESAKLNNREVTLSNREVCQLSIKRSYSEATESFCR